MKRLIFGLLAAAFIHLLILLFGGIFFLGSDDRESKLTVEDVDVVDSVEEAEQKAQDPEELTQRKADEVDVPPETPPDMQQLVQIENEAQSLAEATPELSALSLAALESALGGGGPAGGDFGSTFSLVSGGRIGGTGSAEAGDSPQESVAFSLADLDQAARAVVQVAPSYPADLRQRKVEGVVTVLFVVDPEGRVVEPRVERSSDPGFESPALDAVRRWRFEPAVRDGKKVASKLRIPIRFALNG